MVERAPIDPLEVALVDLGRHVDHPRGTDLSPVVVARLAIVERPSSRSPWMHAAIAAGLLVIVLLALPAPRQALADWLGIGTVRVVHTDQVPDRTGSVLRLGREISLDEARDLVPFTILGPSDLGTPSVLYAGEPSADSVTLLWGAGDDVPAATSGVGVLLTEMPGSTDRSLVEKRLGRDTTLETVTVGDVEGYWITGGPHELQYLDAQGRTRLDTTRLAANTLLWERDGVTFRLESQLDRAAAIVLARDLEPLP